MEEYEVLCEKLQTLYYYYSIPETDYYTSEVLEHTHLNVNVALPCDSEGQEFAKVAKGLCDANGTPIIDSN